jgi:hypothetical protein
MTISKRALFAPIIATLLLAGCGRAASEDVAANTSTFVPPRDVVATPLPGQTPQTQATAYVGKFPNDPVGGVLFFDRTDVSKALVDAVHDNATRAHFSETHGPEKPIYTRDGKVIAAGCNAQDCSGDNWAFRFDPATGTGEACYHDTATMQDSSRWFANGAPIMRPGMCPLA